MFSLFSTKARRRACEHDRRATRCRLTLEALEPRLLLSHGGPPPHGGGGGGGGGGEPALFGFDWAFHIGSDGTESARAVAHGDDGSVYVIGMFTGTVDFDWGVGVHELDSAAGDKFLAKYGPDGDFAWVQQFARNVFATAVDGDKVFVTGQSVLSSLDAATGSVNWEVPTPNFGRSVDVDGAGHVYVAGAGGVAKLSASDGSLDWTANYPGLFGGWMVFHDNGANGEVFVTGNVADEAVVWKLAADTGSDVWLRTTESPNGSPASAGIAVDSFGNPLVTGTFDGTVDFDPGPGTAERTDAGRENVQNHDVFVWKLDSAGDLGWVQSIGGSSCDFGKDIATDASGNVYVTGSFGGTVDFDPGPSRFNLKAAGNGIHGLFPASDAFALKLDSVGDFVWASRMGGDSRDGACIPVDAGRSISVDNANNVYVAGDFAESGDFDPTAGEFTLTSNGHRDVFVLKLTQPSALSATVTSPAPGGELQTLTVSAGQALANQAMAPWDATGVKRASDMTLERFPTVSQEQEDERQQTIDALMEGQELDEGTSILSPVLG